MANYELGRIGLNLRGSYDAAMTYQRLDTVTYNGSSYVALENCSGILPIDTEKWMMLAQGAQGLGVQAGDVITLPMNIQDSSYTTTVSIVDHKMGVISVYIQKSTAFGNYTNNTPLSVASGATPLVLTFA